MIRKIKLSGFEDRRGILIFANKEILDFNYEYLTMGTMAPGSQRGGHYHKRIEEKLLCLSGKIHFTLGTETTILLPGELIDIPVNHTHTLYNIGDDVACFVEFKSENFNHEDDDTYRP